MTDPADTWTGGCFELAIRLPDLSDDSAGLALSALWSNDALNGCYLRNDTGFSEQSRLAPSGVPLNAKCYGSAALPGGKLCLCGSYLNRYRYDDEESDWLEFFLPVGALEKTYPTAGYPFGDIDAREESGWLAELHSWLAGIAGRVFQEVRFPLGFTGWEVAYLELAADPEALLNGERADGILLAVGEKLHWHPPTRYGPLLGFRRI